MTGADQKQQMQQLEARLDAAKKRQAPKPRADKAVDEGHLAWRMVIELVAGLLIGFGMGYGLDSLFGTLPIFLVIFTLLGLAAGIKTMMRSATEIQQTKDADDTAGTTPDTGDDERAKDGD